MSNFVRINLEGLPTWTIEMMIENLIEREQIMVDMRDMKKADEYNEQVEALQAEHGRRSEKSPYRDRLI